jgi:hypothetical protein
MCGGEGIVSTLDRAIGRDVDAPTDGAMPARQANLSPASRAARRIPVARLAASPTNMP